jgi:DNA invertase Pin-like site-specific DNA recombinase
MPVLKSPGGKLRRQRRDKLARPELFRLLCDAHPGDILLVEQVDRLSRLTAQDWERLKADSVEMG